MKKVLVLLVTVLALNLSSAQKVKKVKITDVYDTQISIEEQKKKYKTAVVITEALKITEDFVVNIGDTLTIAESVSKQNNTYQYLIQGRYGSGDALLGVKPAFANISFKGNKVVLESAIVVRAMGRVRIKASLKLLNVGEGLFNLKYVTTFDLVPAIELGELTSDKQPLNREQAIAKLKEAKELFDLDMMSKEEYESIRKELTPIIKNN